jgi:hypothetical protein
MLQPYPTGESAHKTWIDLLFPPALPLLQPRQFLFLSLLVPEFLSLLQIFSFFVCGLLQRPSFRLPFALLSPIDIGLSVYPSFVLTRVNSHSVFPLPKIHHFLFSCSLSSVARTSPHTCTPPRTIGHQILPTGCIGLSVTQEAPNQRLVREISSAIPLSSGFNSTLSIPSFTHLLSQHPLSQDHSLPSSHIFTNSTPHHPSIYHSRQLVFGHIPPL